MSPPRASPPGAAESILQTAKFRVHVLRLHPLASKRIRGPAKELTYCGCAEIDATKCTINHQHVDSSSRRRSAVVCDLPASATFGIIRISIGLHTSNVLGTWDIGHFGPLTLRERVAGVVEAREGFEVLVRVVEALVTPYFSCLYAKVPVSSLGNCFSFASCAFPTANPMGGW